MNLHRLLQQRIMAGGPPVRVGLIGAGKFGSMFLSQVPTIRGLEVPVIADLDPDRARLACDKVGWDVARIERIGTAAGLGAEACEPISPIDPLADGEDPQGALDVEFHARRDLGRELDLGDGLARARGDVPEVGDVLLADFKSKKREYTRNPPPLEQIALDAVESITAPVVDSEQMYESSLGYVNDEGC